MARKAEKSLGSGKRNAAEDATIVRKYCKSDSPAVTMTADKASNIKIRSSSTRRAYGAPVLEARWCLGRGAGDDAHAAALMQL